MPDNQWFYSNNGKQNGPVPETQIKNMFDEGQVNEKTLFWTEEMPKCLPAAEIVTFETYRKKCPPLPTVSSLSVHRCIKSPKRKKPVFAVILGLIFGPFSTLYFGWKALLYTLIIVFGSTFVVTWIMPFPFPEWFTYFIGIFFAIFNYMLCISINSDLEGNHEYYYLFLLNLLFIWYIRFIAVFMGLYSGSMLIKEERWLAALGVVFLLTPLAIYLFEFVTGFLLTLIVVGIERKTL